MAKKLTLKQELSKAKKETDEYKDKYLRALAELENYKKRARKEQEEIFGYANERILLELLPILDNFDRGINTISDSVPKKYKDFYKGIEMIYRNFKEVLEKEGLKSLNVVGEKFNPTKHEAVQVIESKKDSPDIIIEQVEKGYMLKDRIIRPAKVIVSKGREGK